MLTFGARSLGQTALPHRALTATAAPHGTVGHMRILTDPHAVVIGLDGEMSAADLDRGGALIQAGLAYVDAVGTTHVRSDLISWDHMTWDERAAQVHNLDRTDVDAAPRADVVDAQLATWLEGAGATPGRRQVLTVGFNVVAFDHPFFRASLPTTMGMVSRRGIDLNGLCFLLDGWDPGKGGARDWKGWKRAIKTNGIARLEAAGIAGREHDAGFDAALALHGFLWLRELVQAAKTPDRHAVAAGQDPALVAAFGQGLLKRLNHLSHPALLDVAAACERASVNPRKWLGQRHDVLQGRTGLEALQDDVPTVLGALGALNR